MRTHSLAGLASVGLLVVSLVVTVAAQEAPPSEGLSVDRLRRDLTHLASPELGGRATGSPGCAAAAAYAVEAFRAAGLDPAGAKAEPVVPGAMGEAVGQRGYLQPFEYTAGITAGPNTSLELELGEGEKLALQAGDDFSPLGFSASGQAEGAVVFCGYGIKATTQGYDDYKGVDAKGRFVIVFDGLPEGKDAEGKPLADKLLRQGQLRFKAMTAREQGAVGMIVVATQRSSTREDDPELVGLKGNSVRGDAGLFVIDLRRSVAERIVSAGGASLTALQDAMQEEGTPRSRPLPAKARLRVDLVKETGVSANVLAQVTGSDPDLKEEVIVIGAHYDHLGRGEVGGSLSTDAGIHHGADDNASGTSAVIEIARSIAAGPAPRRTIVFALWSAEEMGLLGSRWFVDHPTLPKESLVAMVNLDMVGRLRDGKLTIGGVGTAEEWKGLVGEAVKGLGLSPILDEDGFGPSDHTSFYAEKVPVLYLFSGVHDDYHKPSDTADKINWEGLVTCTTLARRFVRRIDALQERPTYRKTGGTPHGGKLVQRGPSVYFGTIPDYAATDGEGVRLAGVRENGPAAKAGLEAGDRIVRFDGRKILDVYDYTYTLFAKKPGDQVEVVVLRDGERLTLTAVLGRKGGKKPAASAHGDPSPHGGQDLPPGHPPADTKPELPPGHPPAEGHPAPKKKRKTAEF